MNKPTIEELKSEPIKSEDPYVQEVINRSEFEKGYKAGVDSSRAELKGWMLARAADAFVQRRDEEAILLRELADSIA